MYVTSKALSSDVAERNVCGSTTGARDGLPLGPEIEQWEREHLG